MYTNKKASRRKLSQLQKCYNYLHCKAVTSQNVSSEAQVKNVLFRGIIMFRFQDIQVWVLLNPAPTSTQLHLPPPSYIQLRPPPTSSFQPPPTSIHLHPAHSNLHPALCNSLNNIVTKISHIIGQFPQI